MASCPILHEHSQACAWENVPVDDNVGVNRQNILAIMFFIDAVTWQYNAKLSLSVSADSTGYRDFQREF